MHAFSSHPLRTIGGFECLLCGGMAAPGKTICLPCKSELPHLNHACPTCAQPMPASHACPRCLRHPPPFQHCRAIFHYRGAIRHQIHRLKYHNDLAAAGLLGNLMADTLGGRRPEMPECLIPVPLHPTRLRQRGYNQAVEMGRPISRRLDLPMDLSRVHRIRPTESQQKLSAAARRKNVRGAFQVLAKPPYGHIALLDDVMTTGATTAELAHCLSKAGVRRIELWVCARAANP